MDPTERAVEAARVMQEISRNVASVDTLLGERPALIRSARAAGMSWPSLAESFGLSRVTLINLSKIE
ncbi:MAG TPA: hypothetical protein VGM94_06655 [Galbitalea sp.]